MTRPLKKPGIPARTEDERQRWIEELRQLRSVNVNPARQKAIEHVLRTQFDDGWPAEDPKARMNGGGT